MKTILILGIIFAGYMLHLGATSATDMSLPDFQCPAGQFVTGFKSGKPTCAIVRLPAMATRPRGYGN